MLSQIPSVSATTANAIIKEYGSLKCLIKELEENKDILSKIYTETKAGKKRKISKTSQDNIYNFLIETKENTIE